MMKCVLAIVVLLHLCYTVRSNMPLKREIINGLTEFSNLYGNKTVNMTMPAKMHVPSRSMQKHSALCEGVLVKKLKHLLKNVTVPEDKEYILKKLQANLEALGPHEENNQKCRMQERDTSLQSFGLYAHFFRTLNLTEK